MYINLKKYQSTLIILSFLLIPLGAQSEEVTSTFSPGGTLTSTQMTEIKDAVNDNDARVGANTINIGINDSAITDHESRITTLEGLSGVTSYLSIPARGGFVAFDQNNAFAACFPNTFSWSGVGSSLFTAMVNLPHNSTITGFTYHFFRSGGATLETTATLFRQAIPATTSRQEIGSYTSTPADSSHTSGEAPTIDVTRAVVDNQNFTYYVEANLPQTGTLCVDGASITYTTP